MGQKINPTGFRVGYIHDWKSNWFNEREFSDYLMEDIKIREHIENKLSHAGLSADHDREGLGRDRGRHLHRPARDRDRQVRQRGRRPAQGAPQDHRPPGQGEHQGDQAARARRQARRPVDRRAAPEPRRLPPRDEARAHLRDALRRKGRQGAGLRAPRRRRDGAHRGLLRRPRAAAHAARRHRLRLHRGAHHDRPDRRQVLDQQGRGHARGLPLQHHRRGRGSAAAAAGRAAGASEGVVADADAEAGQVPQADARPHARLLQGRQLGRLRRVRAEGDGARLDHQPPDRGRPSRDDPKDQARRQGLDQHLPRQADDREAGRDADGLRQGQPRGLGRRDQARPGHVRARRRARGPGQGRDAPRRPQASDQDQDRRGARGRSE